MKKTACLTLCICLVVFTASFASAQLLDDLWFQVKFKANGFVLESVTETCYPSNHSALGYLHLTWIDTTFYTATVYSFYNDGWHQEQNQIQWGLQGVSEDLVYRQMYISDSYSNVFVLLFLTTLNIKRNASGLKVSFKDKGCFVLDGDMQPAGSFYGSCKLSGKTIDRGKLPFTP